MKHVISKHFLLITFLNEPELIFMHTVKWFQALLFNTKKIQLNISNLFTQLND